MYILMCENQCLSFFCYLLGFFVCLGLFCFSQPEQISSYKKKKCLSLLQNSQNGEWKYIRCSFGLYLLRSRDKGKRRWGMTQLNLGDFCIIFCCPSCWTALGMEGSSGIRETSLGMLNLMQHPKSAEKAWSFLSFLCQLLLPPPFSICQWLWRGSLEDCFTAICPSLVPTSLPWKGEE